MTTVEEAQAALQSARDAVEIAERNMKTARVQERDERRAAEKREQDAHRDRMAAEYLDGYPKQVTDRVYAKAWEHGHSGGYESVEAHYDDFATLIRSAVGPERTDQ